MKTGKGEAGGGRREAGRQVYLVIVEEVNGLVVIVDSLPLEGNPHTPC